MNGPFSRAKYDIHKKMSVVKTVHSNLQVFALSHGLLSNPHISFTAVFPNPPRNLTILKVQNNRLTLKWLPPVNSLYTGYVVR